MHATVVLTSPGISGKMPFWIPYTKALTQAAQNTAADFVVLPLHRTPWGVRQHKVHHL